MREITIEEAKAQSGLSVSHLRSLCRTGLVKARKFGRAWAIADWSLAHYASMPHKTGPKGGRS